MTKATIITYWFLLIFFCFFFFIQGVRTDSISNTLFILLYQTHFSKTTLKKTENLCTTCEDPGPKTKRNIEKINQCFDKDHNILFYFNAILPTQKQTPTKVGQKTTLHYLYICTTKKHTERQTKKRPRVGRDPFFSPQKHWFFHNKLKHRTQCFDTDRNDTLWKGQRV